MATKDFTSLLAQAHKAGMLAVENEMPKLVPMVVQQHENMLDDNSPVVKEYHVQGGVCGFAWVHLTNARTAFAQWCKKNSRTKAPYTSNGYYGGMDIRPHPKEIKGPLIQSMQLNEAYCAAYAGVLVDNGIDAYMQSRID